jgi:hypothetical protein
LIYRLNPLTRSPFQSDLFPVHAYVCTQSWLNKSCAGIAHKFVSCRNPLVLYAMGKVFIFHGNGKYLVRNLLPSLMCSSVSLHLSICLCVCARGALFRPLLIRPDKFEWRLFMDSHCKYQIGFPLPQNKVQKVVFVEGLCGFRYRLFKVNI